MMATRRFRAVARYSLDDCIRFRTSLPGVTIVIEVQARQWLIAGQGIDARGALAHDLLGWRVILGAGTSCIELHDAEGSLIGCLLGSPVDIAAQHFLTSPTRAPWHAMDASHEALMRWITGLGGAFVAFVAGREHVRVYPSSTRTCVWREDAPLVAAAPLSLLSRSDYTLRLDRDLFEAMEIERSGWLPASLTAHEKVQRLLPNHYLDLKTLRCVRYWTGPATTTSDPRAAILRIAGIVKGGMAAVASRYTIQLALTAGRDSRAVLAASVGLGERLRAFTITHDTDGPDRKTPVEICKSLGIPHRLIRQRISTDTERLRWLELSGHCVGGTNLQLHRTVNCFGSEDAVVTGAVGEVGRAFYWNALDTPATPLCAERMLGRLDLKPHPKAIRAMDGWLAGLHGVDTLRVLDLAYIELAMGCLGSPTSLGNPESCFHFSPIDHREVFDQLLSLPPEWRRSGRYIDELIKVLWPELLRWPYNRLTGWRQVAYLAGKALSYERLRKWYRKLVLGGG